jgi:S-DNA-T family DNA segregation ATPase FtsK/SpoIIIE
MLLENFITALVKELITVNNLSLTVIDAENIAKNYDATKYKFFNSNFDIAFSGIFNEINELYDKYKNSNYDASVLNEINDSIIMIIGVEKFKSRLSTENQELLNSMISKTKEIGKYNFIFIDSVDKFKKIEYDLWYKDTASGNQGIWIGNGITNQFSLKLTKVGRDLYQEIEDGFGYVIERGNPTLVKLIEEGDNHE